MGLRRLGVRDEWWIKTVLQHHESWDGSGYPGGLRAENIARTAQIVALADRYCALVSSRTYRKAMLPRLAIQELDMRIGRDIDKPLVAALVATMGIFPPGSLVRLRNGEGGIVVKRLLDPQHPVVYALQTGRGDPYEAPKKRLTSSRPEFAIVDDAAPHEILAPIDAEQLWPPGMLEIDIHAPAA
jgi:hypothetical protein